MKLKITVLALLFLFSCSKKSDLVDTSANQIEDLEGLNEAIDKTKTGVSLVFFHASWCKVCKEQRPAFEMAQMDPAVGTAKFYEVEFDDHKDIVDHFKVTAFPTMVLMKDGKEIQRFNGKGHADTTLVSAIQKLL